MLSKLKQLPLMSKIVFLLSLVALLGWVLPSMFAYMNNVKAQEEQASELKKTFSRYGVNEEAKEFDKDVFIQEALTHVKKASAVPLEDNSYDVSIEVEKDEIDIFNRFLETLSLHYLVKVTSPLTFKEKKDSMEIKMTIKEL